MDEKPPDKPPEDDFIRRSELEDAVRFVHLMSMQSRLAIERIEAQVNALIAGLTKAKSLDEQAMVEDFPEASKRAREQSLLAAHVKIGPAENKYGVATPEIDCEARMPLCQARCCRLTVHLAFQDIDEGIRWEYARPYELRRRESDGYCMYSHEETRSCGIYEKRPSVCRKYDCRADARVWLDFENRIPAPMERSDNHLYAIRRAKGEVPKP
jgi:hypothetical protein